MLAVTILGNNSALPAFDRHPTAQVVTMEDQIFLVDCGEGTQMQMAKYKIRRSKINHIFISHLHGDHYFGLIGLLTSSAPTRPPRSSTIRAVMTPRPPRLRSGYWSAGVRLAYPPSVATSTSSPSRTTYMP